MLTGLQNGFAPSFEVPSFYAPSFRLKRRAWSGYGFGHTALREPGDVRGTAIGKKGRFKVRWRPQGGDV